jgi:hypothetical protein
MAICSPSGPLDAAATVTPTGLRDIPTLDAFLHDLPLLFGSSTYAWFLPMLPRFCLTEVSSFSGEHYRHNNCEASGRVKSIAAGSNQHRVGKGCGLLTALVYWGGFLECLEQFLCAIWHWYFPFEHDGGSAYFFTVEVFVCAVVSAESRT